MSEPVLCFVEGPWAWFTTGPLDDVWGDDWGDAPRGSTGSPYAWEPRMTVERYALIKVAFDGPFKAAPDWQTASDINAARRAWIYGESGSATAGILAGCSLTEFGARVRSAGGEVYFAREREA